MNVNAFLAAPAIVQVHAGAALVSLLAGTWVMVSRKGTSRHLLVGRVFVGAMLLVAVTSFWIQNSGHLSAIHLLSIVTLITLPIAIWQRRRGNISAHTTGMVANYIGLLIAGGFAIVPPRLMGQLLWGS